MDTTGKWFNYLHKERCLSREVILEAQFGEELGRLRIPIFDEAGNELFCKLRRDPDSEVGPKYLYQTGGRATLYGVNFPDLGGPNYFVEGECFDSEAEILTQHGWKKIKDLNKEDKVSAVYEDNGQLKTRFEKPINYVAKHYSGELYEYSDENKYYSLTTPNHNLIFKKKYDGKYIKSPANDFKINATIPRVAVYDSKVKNSFTLDQIRFIVMISADFTIRKEGDLYAGFKKHRKIERFKAICERLNIPYSCKKVKYNMWSCFISRKVAPRYVLKQFNHDWIYEFSTEQRNAFLDEILYWDGNSVPNRNQIEYSSKYLTNSIFVQTLAHLSGYVSTIIKRRNQFGEWYKVSILFGKSSTGCQNKTLKKVPYNDYVYCVQVSSGMLLVRQNDCITVSGNCDALAVRTLGYNGYSSTGGALTFREEWLGMVPPGRENIILFDNDETGIKGAIKVAKMLKTGWFSWVPPLYGKDVSDLLMTVGADQAREILKTKLVRFELNLQNNKSAKETEKTLRDNAKGLDNSVGKKFLLDLAFDIHMENKAPVKRKHHPNVDNAVANAKAYPIENLLKFRNKKTKCLWHKENTPSLHLYPDNHVYCHGGCAKQFDSIAVYMQINPGVTFLEAVNALNNLK
jgi:hypothetical protein